MGLAARKLRMTAPAAGGGGSASVAFLQSTQSTANLGTYTFASQSLGAAASDRVIIVGFTSWAATPSVGTCTIGGVSATMIGSTTTANNLVGLWSLEVPTGTTADIVVTCGAAVRAGLTVWRAVGAAESPTNSFFGGSGVNTTSDLQTTAADGFIVAMSSYDGGAAGFTWSGLTEDHDTDAESGFQYSGASDDFASASNPTITATGTTPTQQLLVGAAWNPA